MRTPSLLLLFLAALFFMACNNANQATDTSGMDNAPDVEAGTMNYTLTPFTPSTEYADASIEAMTYKGGKFNFTLGESDYKLGVQTPDADAKMCANSAQGQHIHLIVDNEPYSAQYTSSFDYNIADGEHYLLAFLSRSYHESIKTEAASVVKKITVASKAITTEEDVMQPMLFYSRPKGTYTGKANTDKVMLDFYLANATLGTEYKVKADINGEVHMIDTWQPYYIEGLPMGENTITLTLVGANDGTVETPLNPVTRTFTLEPDPMEEATQ